MARRTTSTAARPRPPDTGAAETARAERISGLAARIARRIEDFPPISEAVRDKLALILHPGDGHDDPG